jgi:hypothetical protein
MPRMRNPDPNGYLMAMAEKRDENEVEDKPSISALLDRKGLIKPVDVKSKEEQEKERQVEEEERQGQETVDEER